MKNKEQIVFIRIHVWYKTQNYGMGKKVNPHFRTFYNTDEAINFFNSESSAYRIEASVNIKEPKYMYGDGQHYPLFEKGKKQNQLN